MKSEFPVYPVFLAIVTHVYSKFQVYRCNWTSPNEISLIRTFPRKVSNLIPCFPIIQIWASIFSTVFLRYWIPHDRVTQSSSYAAMAHEIRDPASETLRNKSLKPGKRKGKNRRAPSHFFPYSILINLAGQLHGPDAAARLSRRACSHDCTYDPRIRSGVGFDAARNSIKVISGRFSNWIRCIKCTDRN